ncbi:MAG TPA: DUF885 domain-containing protein, partial [Actinomycetota bacterium]|nr:DUF885 domain-containing protein [Actinomycetota bacterium]
LDVADAIARRDLDDVAFRMDRLRAVSHLEGPGSLLGVIASLQRADTPERVDRYVGRLSALPGYVAAMGAVAEEGAAAGVVMPLVVVDRTVAQVERLLALDPADSPGMAPAAGASDQERERVRTILADEVWPAFQGFLEVLRRYRNRAAATIGLSRLPLGDEMYAAAIRGWTSLDLDPQVVHDIGANELARIREEEQAIARSLGAKDARQAVADLTAKGGNAATSREALVASAEEQVRRGWEAAPRFFGRLPKSNCEVRPVEAYREKDMPFAYYYPPSQDGSRAGVYWVNASDLDQRLLHRLASVTYHEANPGHHFQTSLEQEMQDRPALRKFGGILAGSAFIEGWGLYSERLADEMGLYQDQYERIGMLEAQAFRAARLVVDTGIHALGWDRDQVIATLQEIGTPRVDAEIETDRYIATPGQALAYKLGQIEIERWRAEAAEREGASFSLPAFHDRLLELGSLPLRALEREIQN